MIISEISGNQTQRTKGHRKTNDNGESAQIFAVDINGECEKLKQSNIGIFIGSQSDRVFLQDISEKMPNPSIKLSFTLQLQKKLYSISRKKQK